ncbi:MAG: SRPBCC family protein [Ilumatobacter sp.]
MAEHSFVVASNLSVSEAFARLVDLERVTQWDDGIISSTRTDELEEFTGRTFDVVVTGFDGRPTTMVYEITESDEATRFVMTGTHAMMRAVDSIELRTTDDGCELDYHGTLELIGDERPLTDDQLDRAFPKLAAVAEHGLRRFLND